MQNPRIFLIVILFAMAFLIISFNSSKAHIANSNNTQVWKNSQNDLQIQFGYKPERPIIDTFTNLAFSVTKLQTGEHIKDSIASVTVTNGQRLFKFQNISATEGDFSVDYLFPDDGTHQVLLRLDRNDSIQLASFQVFVPHQSPPTLLSDSLNIMIGLALISAVAIITIVILRKN
ncbi:hypothetical protein BH18THE1_BH18THE1_16030 [soil metagenome]